MQNLKWSDSEKKRSRRVFEAALEAELAEIMTAIKAKVAVLTTPDEMWALQGELARKQREVEEKYDYRRSPLMDVIRDLAREMKGYESEMGFTPASRSRVSMPMDAPRDSDPWSDIAG